jgi:hypothetical protein
MDQSKIAVKSKAIRGISNKKKNLVATEKPDAAKVISTNGLNLTLDNSLKKYANDPFFIEHARRVDQKFAKK